MLWLRWRLLKLILPVPLLAIVATGSHAAFPGLFHQQPVPLAINNNRLATMLQSNDLVRLTASELQILFAKGELTSVDLVKDCLAQINRHNTQGQQLRAVISVAPEASVLQQAAKLDELRASGKSKGPLHGIPILLKDAIKTKSSMGMPTTLGSYALINATSDTSASVVEKLEEHGLIVLGKTNLNELVSWKGMGSTNGWSAVGGQTISAYVDGGVKKADGVMGHSNPCGASTGSAVGVSAGFAPVALGTEVDGSLVQPSARAGLYALKLSIHSTDLEGVFAVSHDFDALGAMAKSSEDLASLSELILTDEARAKLPADGFRSFLTKSFDGLGAGFADEKLWYWPENIQKQHGNSLEQLRDGYKAAMDLLRNNGLKVVYPVALPPVSDFMIDGQPCTIAAIRHVFKENMDAYLASLTSSDVRTAEDIAKFNKDHADKEFTEDFPEQGRLIDTLENPIDRETYEKAMTQCHEVARNRGIDKVMEDENVNLVILPMDSPAPRLAAAAGYPIATVPVGTLDYNGRPFGLAVIAKSGREDLLFQFMSAYEAVAKPRPVPPRLTN